LWLFRDDVERTLRDLYGDIEDETLDSILSAVFYIIDNVTAYARKDLWQERHDAVDLDNMSDIDCEGYINGSMWRLMIRVHALTLTPGLGTGSLHDIA
jgi:hypothetical protein